MGRIEGLVYGYFLGLIISLSCIPSVYLLLVKWLAPYVGVSLHIFVGLFTFLVDSSMLWGIALVGIIIGFSVKKPLWGIIIGFVVYVLIFISAIAVVINIFDAINSGSVRFDSVPLPPSDFDLLEILENPTLGALFTQLLEQMFSSSDVVSVFVRIVGRGILLSLGVLLITAGISGWVFSKIRPFTKKNASVEDSGDKITLKSVVLLFLLINSFSFATLFSPYNFQSVPQKYTETNSYDVFSSCHNIVRPQDANNGEYFEGLKILVTPAGDASLVVFGMDGVLNIPLPTNDSILFVYSIRGNINYVAELLEQIAGRDLKEAATLLRFLPSAGVIGIFYNTTRDHVESIADITASQLSKCNIRVKKALVISLGEILFLFMKEAVKDEIPLKFHNIFESLIARHGGLLEYANTIIPPQYDAVIRVTGIFPGNNGPLNITGIGAIRAYYVKGDETHIISTKNFSTAKLKFATAPSSSTISVQVPDEAAITGWTPVVLPPGIYVPPSNNQTWVVVNGTNPEVDNFSLMYNYSHPLNISLYKEIIGNPTYGSEVKIRITIKNNDGSHAAENLTIRDSAPLLGVNNISFFHPRLEPAESVSFEYTGRLKTEGYYPLPEATLEYYYSSNICEIKSGLCEINVPLFTLIDFANVLVPGGIFVVVAIVGVFIFLELYFRTNLIREKIKSRVLF